jgi:hypothetical protein
MTSLLLLYDCLPFAQILTKKSAQDNLNLIDADQTLVKGISDVIMNWVQDICQYRVSPKHFGSIT